MKKIFLVLILCLAPFIYAQLSPEIVKKIKEEIAQTEAKAYQVQPRQAALFIKIGKLYSQINDADRAQSAFEKALEIEPKNDEAHFMLALIFEKKKMDDRALYHWKICLENTANPAFKSIAEKHINYLSRK